MIIQTGGTLKMRKKSNAVIRKIFHQAMDRTKRTWLTNNQLHVEKMRVGFSATDRDQDSKFFLHLDRSIHGRVGHEYFLRWSTERMMNHCLMIMIDQ